MTDHGGMIQLLTDDRAALLVQQPFLALLAMQLELSLDASIRTAATDGHRLRFNPSFVANLEAVERRFVLGHLVWHCALLHPWRRRSRDRAAWDLASDHEANAILNEDFPLPTGATFFEDRPNEDADAVYSWLITLDQLPERSTAADVHANARDRAEQDHALERRWAEHVLTAAQHLARSGRPLPVAIAKLVARLREPRIHWRDVLRRFMDPILGDQRHWLPPNRRHLHRGLYLPARRERLLRCVVGLDTSASTIPLRDDLLSELVGIIGTRARYELTLLQADHELRGLESYSHDRPFNRDAFRSIGGGSTDLRVFFSAISEHYLEPSVLVVLTDGLGPTPPRPPTYPVIWALPTDCRAPAPWGKSLRFD